MPRCANGAGHGAVTLPDLGFVRATATPRRSEHGPIVKCPFEVRAASPASVVHQNPGSRPCAAAHRVPDSRPLSSRRHRPVCTWPSIIARPRSRYRVRLLFGAMPVQPSDSGRATTPTSSGQLERSRSRSQSPEGYRDTGLSIFALLLAFRIVNALTLRTFFQPDEFFQSLEPAWRLAFGQASNAWLTWVRLCSASP